MFVDYENLFDYISRNFNSRISPKHVINSLLDSSLNYVKQNLQLNLASPVAYADFAMMGPGATDVQQSLYLIGMEPRFATTSLQSNASEIQICVDVLETLHNQSEFQFIILVTGDRLYVPLLQYCQQRNVHSLVITFQPPGSAIAEPYSELFLDANSILNQTICDPLNAEDSEDVQSPVGSTNLSIPPKTITDLTDPTALIALEIIDHFFGQYEEIYLTPLLRKLSETLGGDDDPKSLVGILEEAGTVWLEKRKGYPYNYTVLLVNYNHPQVIDLQQEKDSFDYDETEMHDPPSTWPRENTQILD